MPPIENAAGGPPVASVRPETRACACASIDAPRGRALASRFWVRPAGYAAPNSPHLIRSVGKSIITLCRGGWSATERMEAFAAVETAGVIELIATDDIEPCLACIDIAREERTLAGLDELQASAPVSDEEARAILAAESIEHARVAEREHRERQRNRWAFEFDVEQIAIEDIYDGEAG